MANTAFGDEWCAGIHDEVVAQDTPTQRERGHFSYCLAECLGVLRHRHLAPQWKVRVGWHLLTIPLFYRVHSQRFLLTASESMWRLNQYARLSGRSDAARSIYDLKGRFIRMLYDFHLYTSVAEQVQKLPCWGPYGGDGCEGEFCPKCGGTGVYRTIELYRFTFAVGHDWERTGKRFVWHQPKGLVRWPVEVTEADPLPLYEQCPGRPYDWRRLTRDIVTVWVALRFAQGPQPTLPGFSEDGYYRETPFPTRWPRWYRGYGWTQRVRWWVKNTWRRMQERLWPTSYSDDIPF